MISSIQSYFAGKAASYFVNAEADARDALAVIEKVKLKTSSAHPHSKRVRKIFQIWGDNTVSLTVASYSLYFHNGFTDHVYARTVARMVGFTLPQSQHYPYATLQPTDFFLPWLEIFFRYPTHLRQFCEMHNLPLPECSRARILEITKNMQVINIAVNRHTIHAMESGETTLKTRALAALSSQSTNGKTFMQSARRTQAAAIFWDTVFVQLINVWLRLGFYFKSWK